jgi:autotransporter family porin
MGRRAFPIGRIIVLLITVIAGVVAIVHYANFKTAFTTALSPPAATSQHPESPSPHRTRPDRQTHVAAVDKRPSPRASSARPTPSPAGTPTGHPAPQQSPTTSASPTSVPPPPPNPSPSPSPTQPTGGWAPLHFRTLPPGAPLPTGPQCAGWVLAAPSPENRPGNKSYNGTVGQPLGPGFLSTDSAPQARALFERVNGDFTGTTEEILRWASCKWGINENIVFAQAALESWWEQAALGDWGTNGKLCPPTHQPGADGMPGQCPQSYGIMQDSYPHEQASWPGVGTSTAMNVDTAYAVWRSCYDGYETWLNTPPTDGTYQAGDVWGCVGRWFTDRWYTPAAATYIGWVQKYLSEKIWQTSTFRPGGRPSRLPLPLSAPVS